MASERFVKRGDLYYLDFGKTTGSEQNGIRPVIVVSNKMANRYSPTILVSPVTSKLSKKELPTHVKLNHYLCGLNKESQVLLEQIYTVDKSRLLDYIGSADRFTMMKIDRAAEISIQVGDSKLDYENNRNIEELKKKANTIKQLDIFIKQWLFYGRDINEIAKDMDERESRIKDLEKCAKDFGLDYKEFYRPCSVREVENLNVMVG